MEVLPLSLTEVALKLNRRSSADKRNERRKPNWTECENVFLLDQFSIHREILTCKATDASTNLRKQEVWRIICQNLNKQNVQVRRTPAEVRRKWKNLVTAAKKEVWEIRHHAQVTGASRKLSELSQRVLQLHSTTASAVALFMSGMRDANNNAANGGLEDSMGNRGCYGGSSPGVCVKYENGCRDRERGGDLMSHFTPIVQLSEIVSSPNGSCASSGESRMNEFDSGIYEDQVHDLRVNKALSLSLVKMEKNSARDLDEVDEEGGNENPKEDLLRAKLELQVEVFKLKKSKLEIELRRLRRNPAFTWRKNAGNNYFR